ncbi:DnaT-like ssDNA-binding domain-containing protein [Aliiglaciecola sp. CAU 1673]|uniref:DnaT-like ssDNA-binding domain-containing protein n=1 Tax=Aliiglaciecola sp. CAU 1673 TaxID=3032595 RepID=UPI0023DA53F2|nr:DnaT-like ssDNA-binding domain-containing protein [Aliiglaciecola sp. CAU 1673]MDF2179721.1 DnaT-like ssDNA-binding domain-containing protein [Aliiglaciecola sp. CAU 1673]
MTQGEIDTLSGNISNPARVLYCLGLRPNADTQTGQTKPLSYKQLLSLLNAKEPLFERGRQINQLLDELEKAGLVAYPADVKSGHSLNGCVLSLPLVCDTGQSYDNLHMGWQPMTLSWSPDPSLFTQLAQLIGLADHLFDEQDRGEFVAYWLSRPEVTQTPFQWTQKFALHLKKRRLDYGQKPTKRVGNQLVSSTAGISTDENARKLVEKYREKPEG